MQLSERHPFPPETPGRRCWRTADILSLRRRLEWEGARIVEVGPDGIAFRRPGEAAVRWVVYSPEEDER